MYYKKELNSLNFLIKRAIKLYKLALKTCYNNSNSKTRFY